MPSGRVNETTGTVETSAEESGARALDRLFARWARTSSGTTDTSITSRGVANGGSAGLSISSTPMAAAWASRDMPAAAASIGVPRLPSGRPLQLATDLGRIMCPRQSVDIDTFNYYRFAIINQSRDDDMTNVSWTTFAPAATADPLPHEALRARIAWLCHLTRAAAVGWAAWVLIAIVWTWSDPEKIASNLGHYL